MKDNIKKIFYVIVILIIALLSSIYLKDFLENKATTSYSSTTIENLSQKDSNIELIEAYVTKVVDGDTIWVKIGTETKKVRFIGINCPEYTKEIEPYGKEATEYTNEKLYHKTIYLQKDITDTDSYDRLLRYIWTDKIDTINKETISKYLFNYELVKNGLAYSNYYKPDISLQDYLEEAEKQAKENKIGMWQ